MDNTNINRQYKDRLFRMIFGSPKNRHHLLSLYNAVNGTAYTNIEDLEITTIDDVIYMGIKNDVSFIISSVMSLYEHQSTFSPNLPLRGFLYSARIYESYILAGGYDYYGRKLIKIPTPRYIIFYNGTEEFEDIVKIKLSDAFLIPDDSGEYEWTATMYNINFGHNQKLMESCKALYEYSDLIHRIRNYRASGLTEAEAIDKAVLEASGWECIGPFLTKHRSEVKEVLLTEFDQEKYAASLLREGEEAGFQKGEEVGFQKGEEAGMLKISELYRWLHEQDRREDADRIMYDASFRGKLYEEYKEKCPV